MIQPLISGCRQGLLIVSGVTAAVVALFYRAVFSDKIFISRDIQRVYYPLKHYWVERISQGQFPQWYPYDGLGQPFVGMVISGTFHPSNLLYLLFPLGIALKINTLLCYPMAFFGTYLFARRWELTTGPALLAGVLFAFNGYSIGITNNLLYLTAIASFPWALWAADRFFDLPTVLKALAASLLLLLILFAGDSQSFAVCAGLIGVLAAARWKPGSPKRKAVLGALAVVGLSALLGAVQIFPAISVFFQGLPSEQSLETALIWSMHPMRILELILGPLFGGDSTTPGATAIDLHLLKTGMATLWVESIHFGAAGLLLAVTAFILHRGRRQWWLMLFSSAGLLALALGRHAHLYSLLYRFLPGWKAFRYPEKLLPYLFFLLALAAAAGLERVLDSRFRRRRLALATAAMAVLALVLYLLESRSGLFSHRWSEAIADGSAREAAAAILHRNFLSSTLWTSAVMLAAGLLLAGLNRRTACAGLLAALCFAHLAIANQRLYELAFPDLLNRPTLFIETIRARERRPLLGRQRVFAAVDEHTLPHLPEVSLSDRYALSVATAMQPDTAAMWGVESSTGYLPAQSHRLYQLVSQGPKWMSRFSGLFNTRYLTIPKDVFENLHGDPSKVIAQHPYLAMLLIENPTAEPRAMLRRARCASTPASALTLLSSRGFNPHLEAIVECPAETPPRIDPIDGTAEVVSYTPERVQIAVRSSDPGVLVLNDAYYPGWSATIDGVSTPIVPANYAVRGVWVGAGEHQVLFTYRTWGLMLGALVSAFSLIGALMVGVWRCRNSAAGYQKTSLS